MPLPELLRRENLAVFIRRFRTWACHCRCDQALETGSVVKTGEVTRSILEVTHGRQLMAQLFMIWEALNKAVKIDFVMLIIIMEISSPSEAWRALIKTAAETYDTASGRAKKVLEGLEIGSTERALYPGKRCTFKFTEICSYISQRKIYRYVLFGLSTRFRNDVHSSARRESFELSELETEMTRVESFQADFERKAGDNLGLVASLSGGGKSRGGDG